MIDAAIALLQRELENYLLPIDNSVTVVTDNIAMLETSNGVKRSNKIIITVVILEEESTERHLL